MVIFTIDTRSRIRDHLLSQFGDAGLLYAYVLHLEQIASDAHLLLNENCDENPVRNRLLSALSRLPGIEGRKDGSC